MANLSQILESTARPISVDKRFYLVGSEVTSGPIRVGATSTPIGETCTNTVTRTYNYTMKWYYGSESTQVNSSNPGGTPDNFCRWEGDWEWSVISVKVTMPNGSVQNGIAEPPSGNGGSANVTVKTINNTSKSCPTSGPDEETSNNRVENSSSSCAMGGNCANDGSLIGYSASSPGVLPLPNLPLVTNNGGSTSQGSVNLRVTVEFQWARTYIDKIYGSCFGFGPMARFEGGQTSGSSSILQKVCTRNPTWSNQQPQRCSKRGRTRPEGSTDTIDPPPPGPTPPVPK
jgi:hypothetical protein